MCEGLQTISSRTSRISRRNTYYFFFRVFREKETVRTNNDRKKKSRFATYSQCINHNTQYTWKTNLRTLCVLRVILSRDRQWILKRFSTKTRNRIIWRRIHAYRSNFFLLLLNYFNIKKSHLHGLSNFLTTLRNLKTKYIPSPLP